MSDRPAVDVLVVGASFAGLALARTAAARGLDVLVAERKSRPGARVHTTGILVPEAAAEIDAPHRLLRSVPGVRLYAPSLRSVDLVSPGYAFYTTRTGDLVDWLADEARRAGARIVTETRFVGAAREDDGGIRIALDGPGGSENVLARFAVGADGARSHVAAAFGLARNVRLLTGLEIELEPLPDDPLDGRFLHCFADTRLAPGYIAWAAPGPDTLQVGLAVGPGRTPDLAAFLAATEERFGWPRRRVVGRRSGLIPCGGVVRPHAAQGVLLVGDAAGIVSPMTAGGIRTAFRFGRRAGTLLADHLLLGGPPPEIALDRELPRFRVKGLLRRMLDRGLPNAMIDSLLLRPAFRRLIEELYFHRRGASGVDREAFLARFRESTGGEGTVPSR